jgi:hypothetical protein
MDSVETAAFLIVMPLVILALFAPTIVAFKRHHSDRWSIFLVNLFFGGAGIGWVVAMIWAIQRFEDEASLRRCPHCAELVQAEAKLCKHCGSSLVGAT